MVTVNHFRYDLLLLRVWCFSVQQMQKLQLFQSLGQDVIFSLLSLLLEIIALIIARQICCLTQYLLFCNAYICVIFLHFLSEHFLDLTMTEVFQRIMGWRDGGVSFFWLQNYLPDIYGFHWCSCSGFNPDFKSAAFSYQFVFSRLCNSFWILASIWWCFFTKKKLLGKIRPYSFYVLFFIIIFRFMVVFNVYF